MKPLHVVRQMQHPRSLLKRHDQSPAAYVREKLNWLFFSSSFARVAFVNDVGQDAIPLRAAVLGEWTN